jgi:hypothetical protein
LRCEACETMSGGGRALGEMMMLGASVGSWGLRDQMAHFAVPGLEIDNCVRCCCCQDGVKTGALEDSGMTGSCIGWIMDGRTEPVVAGSTLWSRRNRGRGSLLAVVVVLGRVRVKIGRAQFGTMPIAVHSNTMIARVLDEGNSPSLPMSGPV